MGKFINHTSRGIDWLQKTRLVLTFTLLVTVSMWCKPMQAGAAISYVAMSAANAASGNLTISAPTGLAAGDVMIISVTDRGTTATAPTMSSTGWTTLQSLAINPATTYRYGFSAYKVATAADVGATYTVTNGAGANIQANIYAFRGVNATPIDVQNGQANTTASLTVTAPTITTTAANDWVVYLGQVAETLAVTFSAWATTNIPAASWTVINNTGTANGSNGAAFATLATAGATGAGAAAINTSYRNGGVLVALSPAAASGDTLTASANTAIATSPQLANAAGVLMQRFQVAANANTIELNSLTIDDLGSATGSVADADIYIDTVNSPTLPGTAVLIGSTGAGWAGTSTAVTLNLGTTADRTVTSGTSKYIYIVYNLDNTQATKTIQSSVTALGVVAPDSVTAFAAMNSTLITLSAAPADTLTVGTNTAIATNAKESDSGVVMQRLQLNSNNNADGQVVLSSITLDDSTATATSYANVKIYVDSTSSSSLPGTAVLIGSQANWSGASTAITLNQGAVADRTVTTANKYLYVVYDMSFGQVGKTVLSHVTAVGVSSPDNGATGLNFSSNTITLTAGVIATITNCGGCHFYPGTANLPADGTTRNNPAGEFVGNHATHAGTAAGQYAFVCTKCHKDNTAKGNVHSSGFINLTGSSLPGNAYSLADANHQKTVSNSPAFGTCSNIYCHSNGTSATTPPGPIPAKTSPTWGAAAGSLACNGCHGAAADGRPNYTAGTPKANAHITGATHSLQTCDVCHDSVTYSGGVYTPVVSLHNNGAYNIKSTLGYTPGTAAAGGTCGTPGCHGSVAWGGSLGCIDCHAVSYVRKYGRPGATLAAVKTEFGLAWGHKKSGRAAVTDADCIVCHLEGNYTTGNPSATYHQNGNIDLRDPDGAGETPITNISGAAFTFQRFSTSYAANSRTSTGNTSNTDIANVVSQKFCMKCHDAGGATNTTARTPGGTNAMPFGGIALGANYTAANFAIGTQGTIDVASQFATTNSSKHPLLGPLTKDFPTQARMIAPYNNFTRAGTSGTKTAGVVINCFDCHNGDGTTTPLLTTRTVAAHGNAVTIRGTINVTTPTLCSKCHSGYTGVTGHGSGSAFVTVDSHMDSTIINLCANCHVSSAAAVRPVRALDVHGVNALPSTGATKTLRWLAGGVQGVPISFIRNTTNLTNHQPLKIGTTTYSPQCSMTNCASRPNSPYTTGGTY